MRLRDRAGRIAAVILISAAIFAACSDSVVDDDAPATFVVDVVGERFNVRSDDAAVTATLDSMRRASRQGIVSGRVLAGDGGFNAPWSWHLDPSSVHVADLSTEVCDGRPSDVESDLDYWIDTVKQYCPWSSRVVGVQ